jgi:heme-degrading monooxygenase HmoA
MKWMEVIKIQAAGGDQESLERQITELISKIGDCNGMHEIKLYHNAIVDNDACIHLYWESEKAEAHGSAAGLCIIHLLKEFGLISHSVWVEGI